MRAEINRPLNRRNENMTTNNKNKPVHEIRLGSVRAAVWKNQSEKSGAFYSITFARLYKSGDAWKRTESFGRDELPLVREAADMAFQWISQQALTPVLESAETTASLEPNI